MKVTNDDVKRVAQLSMFKISSSEQEMFRNHLESIIVHIDKLNELDTDNTEPTSYILNQNNIMRSDVVSEYENKDELLSTSAETDKGSYVVPQVVE